MSVFEGLIFSYIVIVILTISFSAAINRDFGFEMFSRIVFWPVFVIIVGIKEIIREIKR